MYRITNTHLSRTKYGEHYAYFYVQEEKARCLANAALFYMRNFYTASKKIASGDKLFTNEQVVYDDVMQVNPKAKFIMSYTTLLDVLSHHPDFYKGQTAQWVIKHVQGDFSSWNKAMKAYYKNPGSFTGMPKMPKYHKADIISYTITNQDAIFKLPYTDLTVPVPPCTDGRLKEVKIVPSYDGFNVIMVTESDLILPSVQGNAIGAIDFGVENTVSFVSTNGIARLYKGGALKSKNQWANKLAALHPERKSQIWYERNCQVSAIMNALATSIVNTCVEKGISTLVIGHNKYWKQNVHMGKRNNQTFVDIPFSTLEWLIQYRCDRHGIIVIKQEESYTSKASFIDGDDFSAPFSGTRKNHLYITKDGLIVNADLNGAGNILVKAFPYAFDHIDRRFILKLEVYRFFGSFKKCIPETDNGLVMAQVCCA